MNTTIFSPSKNKKAFRSLLKIRMQRLFTLLFIVFINLAVSAQEGMSINGTVNAKEIELKTGLNLVYDITHKGNVYQYIINFTSVNESGVEFNWKMTDPVNKDGKIIITSNALAKATDLDFYPSTKTFDGEDISMIFGKQVFDKLANFKSGDTVSFGCNSCFRGVTTTEVKANDYEVQDDAYSITSLKTLKFSSIYNNGNFEVLNQQKFPLIIYFKWNMTIELKSFSYTK